MVCYSVTVHFVTAQHHASFHCTYKAVQLGHRRLVARVADVPHLDAALAAGVDMARGVADGDGAHHLPVAESVDLACVTWNARTNQRVWRKRHGLHLSVRTHVKGISSGREGEKVNR